MHKRLWYNYAMEAKNSTPTRALHIAKKKESRLKFPSWIGGVPCRKAGRGGGTHLRLNAAAIVLRTYSIS